MVTAGFAHTGGTILHVLAHRVVLYAPVIAANYGATWWLATVL